jgi:hypothetical protein
MVVYTTLRRGEERGRELKRFERLDNDAIIRSRIRPVGEVKRTLGMRWAIGLQGWTRWM